MKQHKAFTLIELLVVIIIVAIFGALLVGIIRQHQNYDWSDEAYWNPDAARVHEARNQVEQLRIQNELKAQELEILKRQQK